MRRKIALLIAIVVLVLPSCKKDEAERVAFKSDETLFEGGSVEEHFHWCVFYLNRKVKDNYGTNCPSDKLGFCVNFTEDGFFDFKRDDLVGIAFDNCNKFRFYISRNEGGGEIDSYVVKDTLFFWDEEFLTAYNLKEPVMILPDKYLVESRESYYAMTVPIFLAGLESGVMLHLIWCEEHDYKEADWLFTDFYYGFLGENDEPTAVVTKCDNETMILEFRLEYNISDARQSLIELRESGIFEVREGIIVDDPFQLSLLGRITPIYIVPGSYPVVADDSAVVVKVGYK